MIPLAQFIAMDENLFMRQDRGLYLRYQQAHAFAVFLMQWHDGTYREGFFDYVRDAYRGRIKRGSGRSLQDRLGQPYESLEDQFLTFLREGKRPDPAPERATAKTAPGGSIRTVPKAEPATGMAAPGGSIRTVPKPQ